MQSAGTFYLQVCPSIFQLFNISEFYCLILSRVISLFWNLVVLLKFLNLLPDFSREQFLFGMGGKNRACLLKGVEQKSNDVLSFSYPFSWKVPVVVSCSSQTRQGCSS